MVTAFQCPQLALLCASSTANYTCHLLEVLFSSELASCLYLVCSLRYEVGGPSRVVPIFQMRKWSPWKVQGPSDARGQSYWEHRTPGPSLRVLLGLPGTPPLPRHRPQVAGELAAFPCPSLTQTLWWGGQTEMHSCPYCLPLPGLLPLSPACEAAIQPSPELTEHTSLDVGEPFSSGGKGLDLSHFAFYS